MPTVSDVITALGSGETTRPRLTHYSPDGRIELSGRVLLNWVNKAGNCLQDEFDVTVGSRVELALPPGHWRTAYWALAVWQVGATLVVDDARSTSPSAAADVDLRIVDAIRLEVAGDATGSAPLVAVTLAPLARRAAQPLPSGVFDEAAELSTYGDLADAWDEPAQAGAALVAGAHAWTFADVVPDPGTPNTHAPGTRALLANPVETAATLREYAGVWAANGSVVVVADPVATPESVARIARDEQVSDRQSPSPHRVTPTD